MTSCDKNFATTDRNTTIFVVKRQCLGKQTINHKVIETIFILSFNSLKRGIMCEVVSAVG